MLIPIILAAAGGLIGIVYEKSTAKEHIDADTAEVETVVYTTTTTPSSGAARPPPPTPQGDIAQGALESLRIRQARIQEIARADEQERMEQERRFAEAAAAAAEEEVVSSEGEPMTVAGAPPPQLSPPARHQSSSSPQRSRTPPKQVAQQGSRSPAARQTVEPAFSRTPPTLLQTVPEDAVLTAIHTRPPLQPRNGTVTKATNPAMARQLMLLNSVNEIEHMIAEVPEHVQAIWHDAYDKLKYLSELASVITKEDPQNITPEIKHIVFQTLNAIKEQCREFLKKYDATDGATDEKVHMFRRHFDVVFKEASNLQSYISKQTDARLMTKLIAR